jgi:hypothetical protein
MYAEESMTMHNFNQETGSGFTPLEKQFNDRRKDSPMPVLLELVKKVHQSQQELDHKLTKHMTEETDELAKALAKLMADAFPEADPSGHRRHHELVIQQAEERAKFWHEMRLAVAKWAGLGVLSFLVIAAWNKFLQGPH